jgi:PAS domain S-box-containing protein
MGLAAIAADHRDATRREELRRLIDDAPIGPPSGGWLRQALATGRSLRLPDTEPETLRDVGLPTDGRDGDVAVVPIGGTALIVAVRDRLGGRYTDADRRDLERIAAEAARALTAGANRGGAGAARATRRPSGRELLEITSAAIWITDLAGTTTYVNQTACELAGLPAERVIGAPMAVFLEGPEPSATEFDGAGPRDRLLTRPDERALWVSHSSRALFDSGGRQYGVLHTLADVTERHQREVELRTRLDSQQILTRFAEMMLAEGGSGEIHSTAVDLIADLFGAPLVALVAVARDRTEARTLACAGQLDARHPARKMASYTIPADSPTGAAVHGGESIRVDDFGERPSYRPGPLSIAVGARSVACVPIAGGDGCIGVMRPEAGAISEQELAALEAVGGLLSARWPV